MTAKTDRDTTQLPATREVDLPAPPPAAAIMLQAFERATTPDNAQKALEMYERIYVKERAHAARVEYDAAMARVQSRVPAIFADATNDQTKSRYAKTATIIEALKPLYTAEGFSLDFDECDSPHDGMRRYTAHCSRAGHTREYQVDLPPDATGIAGRANKTMIHALKSSSTYAQGILLRRIFAIADRDGDNDGNGAALITEAQAKELTAMLARTGADVERFCEWGGCSEVALLPASKHREAVKLLTRKTRAAASQND